MPVICVGGMLGSGKTTLSRELARSLGYKYFYAGQIFREMAKQENLPIEEFYRQLENNPEKEKAVDKKQVETMNQDFVVAEGRIAALLPGIQPRKLSMFIAVDEEVGAKRILGRPENKGRVFEEVFERTRQRIADEKKRYQELYGIADHLDQSLYDVVIDTTARSPRVVLFTAIMAVFNTFGVDALPDTSLWK